MSYILKVSALFGFLGGYTFGLFLGIWAYVTLGAR